MSSQDKPTDSDGGMRARVGFFASFDRTGSVTVSAGELGLDRNTAFGWARAAGLPSNAQRAGHPGRAEYDRLRSSGTSRRAAAAAAGVHVRTARDRDRGVRNLNGRHLYPDGRMADYARGTISQQPVPPALEKVLHPRFLTLLERERIADLRAGGASMRAVAAVHLPALRGAPRRRRSPYFCDPASPWQRGSNENTNGLLRHVPTGTDLSLHGPAHLEHIAQQRNGRPRTTLGWDTPAQRLRALLQPSH